VSSLTGDRAKAKALYEEGIVLCRELTSCDSAIS
jgi:hypothetical protein